MNAIQPQLPDDISHDEFAPFLRAVRGGETVSRDAAVRLLNCPSDVLPELLGTARALKEQYWPGVITYSRKVFLPLTNLCRDYCSYCTYRRDPAISFCGCALPNTLILRWMAITWSTKRS